MHPDGRAAVCCVGDEGRARGENRWSRGTSEPSRRRGCEPHAEAADGVVVDVEDMIS